MRHIKEILRLKHQGRSHREIARSVRLSVGGIAETLRRAREAELDWERVAQLDEGDVEQRLYRNRPSHRTGRPLPDPAYIHTELRRKGVTLQLLHLEYLADHPERGYGYTQYCDIYKRWLGRQRPTMRQVHRAGERTFLDYAGDHPSIARSRCPRLGGPASRRAGAPRWRTARRPSLRSGRARSVLSAR